jgi:hypothetical protein
MNASQVLAELFRLAGALAPVSPATVPDLEELRRRLAHSLFDMPGDGVPSSIPSDAAVHGVLMELKAIIAAVELERTAQGIAPPRSLILRRELPLHSAHQSESFPARSGGHAVQRTFGPMLEERERFVFFDLFEAADFLRVVRGGNAPFLLIPAEATSADSMTFTFGPGSIWIDARLLAPAAMGFAGLRVAGGTLTIRGVAGQVDSRITVPPEAMCALTLDLAPPTIPASDARPGRDAGIAMAVRPAQAQFEFSPNGVQRITASAGSLTVFGVTVNLTRNDEPAQISDLSGGVLVPFDANTNSLAPADVRSSLFQPAGTWKIGATGWLLPLSLTTNPDDLGKAADAGAMAIAIGSGLSATWIGLDAGPYRAERALVAVDSRELALVADGGAVRVARQEIALWRDSSLELRFENPFRLQFVSSRKGAEAVGTSATLVAHLDRPLQADGHRPRVRLERASFFLSQQADGETAHIFARRDAPTDEIAPLALSNALLKTTPIEELSTVGLLVDGKQLAGAAFRLTYGLHAILPFLPDPYAANFEIPRTSPSRVAPAALVARVSWPNPLSPSLSFTVSSLRGEAHDIRGLLPAAPPAPAEGNEQVRELRALFDQALGHAGTESLLLLDVSSNADQLGVGVGFRPSRLSVPPPITIQNLDLAAPGFNLRIFMLPQVQWEPVRTAPKSIVPPFPEKLYSVDDGGPTLIGVQTVELIPVAPIPVTSVFLEAYRAVTPAAVLFTLPFGIKAVATLGVQRVPGVEGAFQPRPNLTLNQPEFDGLSGARQVTLSAVPAQHPKVSPFLPGAAFQTKNGISPTDSTFRSVLDLIEGFFNGAFGPGSQRPRVPVSRIDFSGYGESCFSQWDEPETQVGVSTVRFDVVRGRTSYEVVRVKSILWPCQAPVVREITIERKTSGAVIRADSGWVAIGPGLFDAPNSQCVFHTGVVKAFHNIREIRDTRQYVSVAGAKFQAVYFDTDIAFENVRRGQNGTGVDRHGEPVAFVAAQDQLGFVQHEPQGGPVSPDQLAALFADQGPIGGPVDCELDVGKSCQLMPVATVYTSVALAPSPAKPEFAVAAFGSLKFAQAGQWSFGRMQRHGSTLVGNDEAELQPVDPRFGIPVIRQGIISLSRAANQNPYRFADPADLLRATDPDADYGLLFAAESHRVLFPRPIIRPDEKRISSEVPPLLADPYALVSTGSLFPKAKDCIPFPSANYGLEIPGEGLLRLTPSPFTFTIPQRTRELVTYSGGRLALEYFDTKPGLRLASVELKIDSTQTPPHSLVLGPVGVLVDVGPFPGLMRVVSRLEEHRPASFVSPIVRYGSVLEPVGEIITVLQNFGLPNPLALTLPFAGDSHSKLKVNFAIDIGDLLKKTKPHAPAHEKQRVNIGAVKFGGGMKAGVELGLGGKPECTAFVEFSGDVQQQLLPGLYVGGFMRFKIQSSTNVEENEIELAIGTIGSVGGDLIRGLLEVEATVKYGYMLVIGDLIKPGVVLAMEAKAKILPAKLKGLVAITFEWEGQAVLAPKHNPEDPEDSTMLIEAKVTAAANVGLALFIEVGIEVEGEFEQEVPLKVIVALGIALGLGILPPP